MSTKSNNAASAAYTVASKDATLEQLSPLDPNKMIVHEASSAGVGAGVGPVSYESTSEADKRYQMIKQFLISNATGAGMTPAGMVHAQDRDFELIAQKMAEQENAHYDAWLAKHIDWSNPASIAVWRNAAPSFFDRVMRYVSDVNDLQTKVAVLMAKGFPTTEEEARLLYMIDTGQVNLNKEAPHRLMVSKATDSDKKGKKIIHGWLHQMISHEKPHMTVPKSSIESVQRLRLPWADPQQNVTDDNTYGIVTPYAELFGYGPDAANILAANLTGSSASTP